MASFPQPRSFSYWPQEKATVAYESGVVRKMRRTPVYSLTQNVGDRRVFWLGCSCCTAGAWSSFVPLLQEVSSICKTRSQLQEKLPLYLGFFEFVHNVRKRGKALLGALIELLVT